MDKEQPNQSVHLEEPQKEQIPDDTFSEEKLASELTTKVKRKYTKKTSL